MKLALPHILGSDIAGEIVRVGDLCERIKPGQRALLSPGLSCRQCTQCVSGIDNQCRCYTMFGTGVDGGNREFMPAPEYADKVYPMPEIAAAHQRLENKEQFGKVVVIP
jgi:D-arabinose 1-dehydrogenase-like Zn-dependent alcohol dehydrogenase